MSDPDDEDLSRLVAELVTALRDLERELDPPRGPRPPSPRELRRFTSEVAIPGVILVLETNIRALRLLQRALEVSERADRTREDVRLGERARSVSDTTLDKLDDALADLEGAIEGRPDNEEAARLLDDARRLRAEVQTRLEAYTTDEAERDGDDGSGETDDGDVTADSDDAGADEVDAGDDGTAGPQVDVDAELESIKAELDEGDASENGAEDDSDEETTSRQGPDDEVPTDDEAADESTDEGDDE